MGWTDGYVLTNSLRTIGPNKVAVPKYYYKIILDYHEPEPKGIGFILPNCSSLEPLQRYAASIDSVEHFTGIDFFPKLDDDLESWIESDLTVTSWSWTSSTTANQKEKTSLTGQCIGVTKSGARCKNKTRNSSGYCYLHEGQNKYGD